MPSRTSSPPSLASHAEIITSLGRGSKPHPPRRLSPEAEKDKVEALQRVTQTLDDWEATQRSLLVDLGLYIEGYDGSKPSGIVDRSKLTSLINKSDPSIQPRRELWKVVNNQT
jgi:hypothetical protein